MWDARSREPIDEFVVNEGVRSIAFAPTGTMLAVGDGAGWLRIWTPDGGRPRRLRVADTLITALSWSPDGGRVALGTVDGRIDVVDVDAGVPGPVQELARRSSVLAVAWVGGRIAYVGQAMEAGTIDPRTGEVLTQFELVPHGPQHEGVVIHAGFSPDGAVVATIADNGNPYLWDTMSGQRIAGPYAASFGSIEWSPDGRHFVSGTTDLLVHDRELGNDQPFPPTPPHHGLVQAAAWSPDGRRVVTISDDGSLRWWSAQTGRDAWAYEEPTSLRWADDGVIGLNGGLHRWEVEGGPRSSDARIPDGVLSPNGSYVAANEAGWLAVYDVANHRYGPAVEAAPNGFVSSVGWSPDGSHLASQAGHDGTRTVRGEGDHLRIWTVGADSQLSETASLLTEDLESEFIAWAPSGESLVLVDPEGLSIWNLDDSAPAHVLDVSGSVFELAFDPSGSHAAIPVDGSVRVVDTATWSWMPTDMRGDVVEASPVAWSPDGTLLATADSSLMIFDVATGTPLGLPVRLSEWWIKTLSWSPDGRRIAAAGGLDPPVLQLVEAWGETDACALVIDALGDQGVDELIGDGRTSVCNQEFADVEAPLPVVLTRFAPAG